MRIRKQPRRLPVCRDDFPPCCFHVEGWTTHDYLDVVNEGADFSDKAIRFAGLATDPTEQFVAAMLQAAPKITDDVKPDPNAITMSRAYRLQQTGDGRDNPVWVPQILTAQGPKVQDGQEKSKVSDKGSKLPSLFALNLVGETPKTLVSCGESSSPSADPEMINIDQMKSPDPSNHLECYTKYEDDNRTRHYLRRGLRNCGDGVTQNPTGETIPVKDILATFSKTSSYERDGLPYYEKKVSSWSRHITRSTIPGDSNAHEDHPLSSPEGSLLHSLYLQLLAAGPEGISLRGLYASFESQTSLPRFASNWREKVRTHLKNGPYFEEVKGRYILCEFLVQPSSKTTSKRKERSESLGVQTRRKAHQKTHEAVLSASAQGFQKLQRQKINEGGSGPPIPSLPNEAIRSDPDITQQTLSKCISSPIRLTKPANEGSQVSRNIRFGGAIPGSLKAMKARIIAETGVQVGVRCARKDGSNDSSKWQCPMMAMEGHTLCEHHSVLNERKRARYAKARRQGDRKIGNSVRRHLQEKPAAPGLARSPRKNHGVRSSEAPRSELQNSDSDDPTGLDEFASQALLTMKDDILVEKLNQDNPLYVPDFNPFQVDGSRLFSVESTKAKTNLAPYFFARSPTGRFIAAKKTGIIIPALSLVTGTSLGTSNVSSTLPPITSMPEFYGPRRKTVKNRSLLSIN